MNTTINVLGQITQLLLTANVATPIIGGTVMAIASIIKGITGSGPTLTEIADMLQQTLGANDAAIRAEIARLEALNQ